MGFFDDDPEPKKKKSKPRKKAQKEPLYSLSEIKDLFQVFKDAVGDKKK